MKKLLILSLLALSISLSACESDQIEISEQKLNQYIEAVSTIKDKHLSSLKMDTQTSREQLEQVVKKAGFSDLDSFLETHTEISWALAQSKSQAVYQDLKQSVQGSIDNLSNNLKIDPDLKQEGQKLQAKGKNWWQNLSTESHELSNDSQNLIDKNLEKLKQALN